MRHIIAFSGGKDSTATIILAKKHGLPMDEIVTVMPDPFKRHEEFISRVGEFAGLPVKVLEGPSFEDYFFTKKTKRSKHPGTFYGWPMAAYKTCSRVMKWDVMRAYIDSQEDTAFILGIAADEQTRLDALIAPNRSYLQEFGVTEKQATKLCKEYGLLNPLYKYFSRLGCVRCPKQTINALRKVRELEPEKWRWCKENDHLSPVSFRSDGRTFADIAKMIEAQTSFACGPNKASTLTRLSP
jgi:3'-phosphoadenosine 5'-phosphosulfate sulfotransferase (PAPS reductase)/FAD synthetase